MSACKEGSIRDWAPMKYFGKQIKIDKRKKYAKYEY
jgi:hypothetical protein